MTRREQIDLMTGAADFLETQPDADTFTNEVANFRVMAKLMGDRPDYAPHDLMTIVYTAAAIGDWVEFCRMLRRAAS